MNLDQKALEKEDSGLTSISSCIFYCGIQDGMGRGQLLQGHPCFLRELA